MPRERQRIVTGINDQGRSTIVSSGPAPARFVGAGGEIVVEDLWLVNQIPPPLDETENPIDSQPYTLEPPPGGVKFGLFATQPRSGPMHLTETLDFIVIISGEIYLVMEEGEVLLHPGDTVIQRGTNHSWDNRSDGECVLAGVLISSR